MTRVVSSQPWFIYCTFASVAEVPVVNPNDKTTLFVNEATTFNNRPVVLLRRVPKKTPDLICNRNTVVNGLTTDYVNADEYS